MKRLNILLSTLLALVTLVPSVLAQPVPADTTTSGVVSVQDIGVLEVVICQSNAGVWFRADKFGNGSANPVVTSSTGVLAGGKIGLCFVDTRSYRGAFSVKLGATHFVLRGSGGAVTIDSDNLWIFRTHRINRTNVANRGLIPANEGTMYSVGPPGTSVEWDAMISGESDNNIQWPTGYNLTDGQIVARAEAGRAISLGTEGTHPNRTARQAVVLNLNIPAGTAAGIYDTEITVSIVYGDTP